MALLDGYLRLADDADVTFEDWLRLNGVTDPDELRLYMALYFRYSVLR